MHANIVGVCLDKITHTQLKEMFSSSTHSSKGYGVDKSSPRKSLRMENFLEV